MTRVAGLRFAHVPAHSPLFLCLIIRCSYTRTVFTAVEVSYTGKLFSLPDPLINPTFLFIQITYHSGRSQQACLERFIGTLECLFSLFCLFVSQVRTPPLKFSSLPCAYSKIPGNTNLGTFPREMCCGLSGVRMWIMTPEHLVSGKIFLTGVNSNKSELWQRYIHHA